MLTSGATIFVNLRLFCGESSISLPQKLLPSNLVAATADGLEAPRSTHQFSHRNFQNSTASFHLPVHHLYHPRQALKQMESIDEES
jgi:hypothetical protein